MAYSKKVIETFKNPRNYGKIKNYDGLGKVGNFVCGDVMWLYIKTKQNKDGEDVIKDISFETFGCIAALASSSIVTDLVKGKTIEQALKITKQEILDKLGGLPPIKIHCSVLAIDALHEAIYDYLKKNKKKISSNLEKRHKELEK
ncbi:MAG: iron-sulfur cluster assembly scaffold protein, partial [Candidatus Parcubacteria bacterium]|nr:iron-sulfur cluster assembly scaffold protein [Candidatus Parcubacteria bacterium]